MAKIVTITNPLTGQPAQVDQLDHTAQQIDDGLNIARGVSNPNLLDNWYFVNPVDQRGGYVVPPGVEYMNTGGTVVAGTTEAYYKVNTIDSNGNGTITVNGTTYWVYGASIVRGYTGTGYGIDRWKGYDGTTALIVSGGLKLAESADNSNDAFIIQFLPNFADFAGKTLTFSVLVLSSTGPGVRIRISDGVSITTGDYCTSGVCTVTHTFNSNPTDLQVTIRGVTKQAYETVLLAAKLELGSQQTLAHQDENGVWQLNEIPDYGEQLTRCQRYFYAFNFEDWPGVGTYWGMGASSTIIKWYNLTFPVTMRVNPSINLLRVYDTASGTTYDVVTNGHYNKKEGLRAIDITSGMTVTVDRMYIISKAQFSADL